MIPQTPPPPPRHLPEERIVMAGSSDDINLDKVKAVLQKKRIDSGVMPAQKMTPPDTEVSGHEPATSSQMLNSDEVDPEKVKEMLRQTRACAVKNAQSSDQLKEAQSSTPGRGIQTSKFRVKPQHSAEPKKQKKEKSP